MPETVATLAVGLVVDMAGAFKQLDTGLGKLANKAATGGKLIAGGLAIGTAAVTAFAKKSVEMATDFESQMAIMSTAVEPLGPEMEDLHQAMLKVGADNELIGITASEAAEATTNFYKAGLETNDIFGDYNAYMEEGASLTGALRASIDLAAASDIDLAAASSLVAITMAQYGLEAENATDITNAFVKAADASQSEVSDLSVAMSYVGPTAKAMNIELDDTLIALAMLSEGGIKGSSAGTALNRVLSDLVKGSDKSKKAMAELGIEVFDAEGKMKPFPELLAHINDKLGEGAVVTKVVGGVTDELTKAYGKANEKIPTLSIKISEQEQQLAILNRELDATIEKYGASSTQADKKRLAITKLENRIVTNKDKLAEHLGVVDEYKVALESATTVTRELTEQERAEYQAAIFTTQARRGLNVLLSKGTEGWEEMAAKVETASTAEEVAAARTNTFAGTMEKLEGTIETLQIMVGDTLLPVLGSLADLFNEFVGNYTPQITAAFEGFAGIMTKGLGAIKVFIANLSTGQGIIESFSAALTFLLPEDIAGKITDFINGASELIDKVIETATSFVEWKDVLIGVGIAIATIAIPVLWSILSPFLAIGAVIAGAVLLVAGLRTAWEEDFLGIRTAVEFLGTKFAEVWALVKGVFDQFWAGFSPSLTAMYERLQQFWVEIQPKLQEAWLAIQEAWVEISRIWDETLAPALNELLAAFGLASDESGSFGEKVGELVGKFAEAKLENILNMIVAAIDVLVVAVAVVVKAFEVWAIMTAFMIKGLTAFVKYVIDVADAIVKTFEWLKKQLVGGSIIPDMMEEMLKIITEFVTKIVDFFRTKFEEILSTIIQIGQEIQNEIKTRWNAITSYIWETLSTIARNFLTKFNEYKNIVITKLDEIKSKVIEKMDAVRAWFETKWNNVRTIFRTKLGEAKKIVSDALDAIEGFLKDLDLTEEAKAIINTIKSGFNAKVGEAKGVISGLISDIRGIISGANLYELGVNIINSLKDGIIDQLDAIFGEIQQRIEDFWERVTNLLGDGEEVTTDDAVDVGQSFGQSFAAGFRQGLSRQFSPGSSLASSTVGDTSYTFSMEVHTNAPVSTVMQDFDLMRAMAGAG